MNVFINFYTFPCTCARVRSATWNIKNATDSAETTEERTAEAVQSRGKIAASLQTKIRATATCATGGKVRQQKLSDATAAETRRSIFVSRSSH